MDTVGIEPTTSRKHYEVMQSVRATTVLRAHCLLRDFGECYVFRRVQELYYAYHDSLTTTSILV